MNECKIETMQADGLGKFVGEKTRMPAEVFEQKLEDEHRKEQEHARYQ